MEVAARGVLRSDEGVLEDGSTDRRSSENAWDVSLRASRVAAIWIDFSFMTGKVSG